MCVDVEVDEVVVVDELEVEDELEGDDEVVVLDGVGEAVVDVVKLV